jgi:hypothetical protein
MRRAMSLPEFPRHIDYGDIVAGLPILPNSCELMYASHVLEHLALEDFRKALRNTRSYLRGGGIFRLVVPDMERLSREYLASADANAVHRFLNETRLGASRRETGFTSVLRERFGSSAHLWMWDYKGLAAELKGAGFSSVRRADFGDSSDPRFQDVEIPERWNGCLGIECIQ